MHLNFLQLNTDIIAFGPKEERLKVAAHLTFWTLTYILTAILRPLQIQPIDISKNKARIKGFLSKQDTENLGWLL